MAWKKSHKFGLIILDHHYITKSYLLKFSFHSIIVLLNKNCSLKDLGSLNYLEIEVKKTEIGSLLLSQEKKYNRTPT